MALTVPAYVAADLVRRECPDAAAALKALDYPPVAAVTVAYPMSAIRQDRLNQANELPGASARSCTCIRRVIQLVGGPTHLSRSMYIPSACVFCPEGHVVTRRVFTTTLVSK